MRKVINEKLSKEELESEVRKVFESKGSKSSIMKKCFDLGLDIGEIRDGFRKYRKDIVRYNFVYNVIRNYVLVNSIEVVKENKKGGRKEEVRKLLEAGNSVNEIVSKLKMNLNYVYKLRKEIEEEESLKSEEVK